MFGSETLSGRSELLQILAGIRYPTDGFCSLLGVDSKRILRGMTFGMRDEARDSIHGTCVFNSRPRRWRDVALFPRIAKL